MKRREFIIAAGAAAAWPLAVGAQESKSLPKIGLFFSGPQSVAMARSPLLLEGLRSAGVNAPSEATLIIRATGGDPAKVAPMLAELLAENVDVIVPLSPEMVRAVRAATSTIPIVTFDLESDPEESGFLKSFAHPGGNITGLFLDFPNFARVWLQLLKEAIPGLAKLAVIWDPTTSTVQTRAVAAEADSVGLKVNVLEVRSSDGLNAAFDAAADLHPDGLMLLSSPTISIFSKQEASLAISHRLPAISLFSAFARSGGLMSYGPDLEALYHKVGALVGRILKGARPADTPAERPDRFELVLNVKAASDLGLTLPNSLLARADEVID